MIRYLILVLILIGNPPYEMDPLQYVTLHHIQVFKLFGQRLYTNSMVLTRPPPLKFKHKRPPYQRFVSSPGTFTFNVR